VPERDLTTEDTERHRGSQRKAEMKKLAAEIFASGEENRIGSTEVQGDRQRRERIEART
jgi:hypothetical protein